MAQSCPLPSRILHEYPGGEGRALCMDFVKGRDHAPQSCVFTTTDVRSRMHDEIAQPKRLSAVQFIHEGGDRLAIEHIVWSRKVDEIGVMRCGKMQSGSRECHTKGLDLAGRERFRIPLIGILGEELNCIALQLHRGRNRVVQAAGDRKMSTKEWHAGLTSR